MQNDVCYWESTERPEYRRVLPRQRFDAYFFMMLYGASCSRIRAKRAQLNIDVGAVRFHVMDRALEREGVSRRERCNYVFVRARCQRLMLATSIIGSLARQWHPPRRVKNFDELAENVEPLKNYLSFFDSCVYEKKNALTRKDTTLQNNQHLSKVSSQATSTHLSRPNTHHPFIMNFIQ